MIQRIRLGAPEIIEAERNGSWIPSAKDRSEALTQCILHFSYPNMSLIPSLACFPSVMAELGIDWYQSDDASQHWQSVVKLLNPSEVIGTLGHRRLQSVLDLGSAMISLGNKVGPGDEIIEFLDLTSTLYPGKHALHD